MLEMSDLQRLRYILELKIQKGAGGATWAV